jgi:starch-binding outer membrane protein, SusD/RagB family
MYNAGLIRQLAIRSFDPSKQYLWPIPTKEVLINDNLEQNPGY